MTLRGDWDEKVPLLKMGFTRALEAGTCWLNTGIALNEKSRKAMEKGGKSLWFFMGS